MKSYGDFLAAKRISDPATGMPETSELPSFLFPHQRDIVRWALRRGRAAVFAGTGLGKTAIELVWANAVADHLDAPVLVLTPLAVAAQHMREAQRFGLRAKIAQSMNDVTTPGVYITNYGKIDRFGIDAFRGIVLDESSILKAVDGKTRTRLIADCLSIPFRLAATATPAPNDFMELGNHAQFLGVMSHAEMLAMFFIHDGGETQKWRLKRHGEDAFWRWMASWAVMLRHPRDLGYDEAGYDLPPLETRQHVVEVEHAPANGMLFQFEARTMQERVAARRTSIKERIAKAAEIVASKPNRPWLLWCQLNADAEALTATIPGAVEVRGTDDEADKERKLLAFCDGGIRILVTKPTVAGFGMNLQHCSDMVFVGLNDSFEQVYQATRRCWRFGQTRRVTAHFIASELEGAVVANLARKEADADRMAEEMVRHTADLNAAELRGVERMKSNYTPRPLPLPPFMETNNA